MNYQIGDNYISDKHVKNFIQYEYRPEKVQLQLNNVVVYDSETFNTDRAVPYSICICKLNKRAGKNNLDIKQREYERRLFSFRRK